MILRFRQRTLVYRMNDHIGVNTSWYIDRSFRRCQLFIGSKHPAIFRRIVCLFLAQPEIRPLVLLGVIR